MEPPRLRRRGATARSPPQLPVIDSLGGGHSRASGSGRPTHLRRLPPAFETVRDALGGYLVEARLFGPSGREIRARSLVPPSDRDLRNPPAPGAGHGAARGDRGVDRDTARTAAHRRGAFRPRPPLPTSAGRCRRRSQDGGRADGRAGRLQRMAAQGPVHRRLASALPVHTPVPTWPVGRPLRLPRSDLRFVD